MSAKLVVVSQRQGSVGCRGGMTGAVQLKQLATDYSQQKRTTWAGRGQIIIAQSKANCLSCTAPVVPPLCGMQKSYKQHNFEVTY